MSCNYNKTVMAVSWSISAEFALTAYFIILLQKSDVCVSDVCVESPVPKQDNPKKRATFFDLMKSRAIRKNFLVVTFNL